MFKRNAPNANLFFGRLVSEHETEERVLQVDQQLVRINRPIVPGAEAPENFLLELFGAQPAADRVVRSVKMAHHLLETRFEADNEVKLDVDNFWGANGLWSWLEKLSPSATHFNSSLLGQVGTSYRRVQNTQHLA